MMASQASYRKAFLKLLFGQNGADYRHLSDLNLTFRARGRHGCSWISERFAQQQGSGGSYVKCRFQQAIAMFSEKFDTLAELFAKQCNAIAAQRLRRATQIAHWYSGLGYDRHAVKNMLDNIGSGFYKRHRDRRLYFLFGACAFSWEKEKITANDVKDCIGEIEQLQSSDGHKCLPRDSLGEKWEKVIERDHLVAWRKPVPNSHLYEYKVFGTFYDIPARAFFDIQTDLEYRKQWDKLIVKLDVVDRDTECGNEVIQWIMHFPYPMYSREYVYVRKTMIDHDAKVMLMMSRSTDHPYCPQSAKYVRVSTYKSNMVIKPHGTFDENGFDYILSYQDDPQAAFPSAAYNWMASTGVPDFVEKIHDAARQLHEQKRRSRNPVEDYSEESGKMAM